MNSQTRYALALCLLLSGPSLAWGSPQDDFFERMEALCGQAFAATMTHFSRPSDDGWLDRPVVMHVRECSENEIKIPLQVGDNRSRTWVITRTDAHLSLKHDHRHEDGSDDAVTWYGGHSTDPGRAWRQTFPADDYSKALFLAHGLEPSVENFWSMEIHPEDRFAYEMVRSRRLFRAEFDLTRPVEPPPAPWGHESESPGKPRKAPERGNPGHP